MRKCKRCGAEVDADAKFCMQCGNNEFVEDELGNEQEEEIFAEYYDDESFDENDECYDDNADEVISKSNSKYNLKSWYLPAIISIIMIVVKIFSLLSFSGGSSASSSSQISLFAYAFIVALVWVVYGVIILSVRIYGNDSIKIPGKINALMIFASLVFSFFSGLYFAYIADFKGKGKTLYTFISMAIFFFIYYFFFRKIAKEKEKIKAGIKRPKNIVFRIFCWFGWLIAFLIYGIGSDWDFDSELIIPVMIFAVIPGTIFMYIYFAPYLIANSRGHVNENPIFILNILAGWTIICWIIAIVWAFTDATLVEKKKRYEPIVTQSSEERIAVLFNLYQNGAITQSEFEERKKMLLSGK